MNKSDICLKLEHLEKDCPCGVNVLLLYGTVSLHEVLSINATEGIIDINFRGKDYKIVPVFTPTIPDETITLAKYNPE